MEPGESCHRRPRFRICSRSWFLTYPKCSLGKEEALALLKAKRPAKGIVVARELHEDGTPHLHAYVMLNAEFNCTASSYWGPPGLAWELPARQELVQGAGLHQEGPGLPPGGRP